MNKVSQLFLMIHIFITGVTVAVMVKLFEINLPFPDWLLPLTGGFFCGSVLGNWLWEWFFKKSKGSEFETFRK